MTDLPSSLRTAQAIGIISASFLSGGLVTTSALLAPAIALYPAPQLLVHWRKVYNIGSVCGPLFAVLSSSSFAVLSYQLASTLDQKRAEVYAVAAGAAVAVMPFTLTLMRRVNASLMREESAGAGKGDESGERVRRLVGEWVGLNYWRAGLPLLSAVFGTWATFG